MTSHADRLAQETAALDDIEGTWFALAQEEKTRADIEAQWIAESRRRVELLDRGEMSTISAEDLHAGVPITE